MSFDEEPKWPKSLPDLQRLDQLLRCGICYDFVKTALMTPCSHNFCSLCIRKYMQYKTSCPACLVETVETQLKNNRVLDELVKILERLKPPLCKALTGSGHELGLPTSNEQPKVTPESTYSDQPKVTLESTYCEKPKVTQNSTVIEEPKFIQIEDSNFRQNSPKIQPKPIESTKSIFTSLETNSSVTTTQESLPNSKLSEALKILENNVPFHSTLTLDKNKQFSAKLPGGQEQRKPSMGRISPEVVTLAVVDKPQAFPSSSSLPASPQKPIKRTIADMFKKSPMKKSGLSNQQTLNPVSPVKSYLNTVSCPVCSVNIPNININQHLDACLKNEKVPPKPSTKVMKSRQPLPKLVYRLLKEKDLKMKLAEQKLNTQGDRKTLEKRYQRYLVLYNSECDKADPRPVSEIVKQLEREEREENRSGCKTLTSLASQVDRKSDPKDIDRAQKQYLSENKSSFDALIASMKRRKAKKVEPPFCTATSSSDTSNLAPSSPTTSTSTASSSFIMQPITSEVKEKSFQSSAPTDQEASTSQEQSDSRQSNIASPSLLSPVYGLGSQSPSLLSQNSPQTPSVKSPILGKKRLFPSTKISIPPALDEAPILISDDSNSTVFSEGDLSQIDIAISQHNSSATEVKGDNNSAEFSSQDFAQIDNVISQHNNSVNEMKGDNNSAEFSSGDLAQIDNAISQHMNKRQMEVDEDSVDPWEIPIKPTGHRNLIYDSSDSDDAFIKVKRCRSTVPLPSSPVAQRQRRSRKRQVPEQSNEPRRSSRKKPKSK